MVHVLLTNDDGPLSDQTAPYVKSLVDAIGKYTDWELSIVVPHTQRSWIGKAHFAGKDLTTSYIYPTGQGNDYKGPFPKPQQDLIDAGFKEWALVDGTPASCADIGINHLYQDTPVDLVISGPNFGRNSSAVYITSSGTVGAAMEASLLGKKAIGLSYAFESRSTEQKIVDEASKISIGIIKHLLKTWNDSVDLYTVNVPLVPSLRYGETKISFAPILENRWGTLFEKIEIIKESGSTEDIVDAAINQQIQFKWKPNFHVVHKTVLESEERGEHNDGVVIHNGGISVTPLKAIFKGVENITGEIKLDDLSLSDLRLDDDIEGEVYLSIDKEAYIYPAIKTAVEKHLPKIKFTNEPHNDIKTFQYGDYEELNFDRTHIDKDYLVNSYIYRKALIRKHYLAHTIHSFVVKNHDSILISAFPETFNLEVDYAEFLDDSLDEAYELRTELEKEERYWILKPSMSDKGQGIRIFKTIDQLQAIFDSFEEDATDEEIDSNDDSHGIITSQLRHFVVQEYLSKPLLLSAHDEKKFHFRVYVLADGDLKIFVFKRILTLFSSSKYRAPSDEDFDVSMVGHLTNTCLQEEQEIFANTSVVEFWELKGLTHEEKEHIFNQICEIVGEVFKAASSVDKINFQPLSNAFEIFGLDFIIDENLQVKLLEINSYPDFKQTGDDLKSLIYDLFESVVKQAVVPFFGKHELNDLKLVKVLDQTRK